MTHTNVNLSVIDVNCEHFILVTGLNKSFYCLWQRLVYIDDQLMAYTHCLLQHFATGEVIKPYSQTLFRLLMWLNWRFCSVINVHKLFNIPQKLICLLKRNCRLHRHAEPLKITGSHLRAVRKAVEHLSFSLGGWLHVVDTFASSKMRTDKLNMCENVWAACGKTPLVPLKRFPPPLKDYTMFWGPLSVEQLLQQPVVNKLLGLDAQKAVAV